MASANKKISLGQVISTIIKLLILPALVLFLSGDWLWVEGWLFSVWFITLCVTTILYLYRHDPALLAERYKQPGADNQQGWDKYVVYALAVGFMTWLIVMPLDAKRFAWSAPFPWWLQVLGGVGLTLSFFFFYRAYTDNTFVSPLVRIQTERKQQVVSTGVYGFVRHPMYLGGILLFIGTPLLLGSVIGALIGLAVLFLLAGRIIGEEKILVNELEGYSDYRLKVRYRLIPFIW